MPKEKKLSPPSEEFKQAVRHAGSIYVSCDLCGREHFGNYENELIESLGEEDYNELLKNSKENPDKYVFHSDEDYISWGYINGMSAVVDCQCNILSQYENLFWNSRNIISEYFSARTQKELNESNSKKNLADKVKDSIK